MKGRSQKKEKSNKKMPLEYYVEQRDFYDERLIVYKNLLEPVENYTKFINTGPNLKSDKQELEVRESKIRRRLYEKKLYEDGREPDKDKTDEDIMKEVESDDSLKNLMDEERKNNPFLKELIERIPKYNKLILDLKSKGASDTKPQNYEALKKLDPLVSKYWGCLNLFRDAVDGALLENQNKKMMSKKVYISDKGLNKDIKKMTMGKHGFNKLQGELVNLETEYKKCEQVIAENNLQLNEKMPFNTPILRTKSKNKSPFKDRSLEKSEKTEEEILISPIITPVHSPRSQRKLNPQSRERNKPNKSANDPFMKPTLFRAKSDFEGRIDATKDKDNLTSRKPIKHHRLVSNTFISNTSKPPANKITKPQNVELPSSPRKLLAIQETDLKEKDLKIHARRSSTAPAPHKFNLNLDNIRNVNKNKKDKDDLQEEATPRGKSPTSPKQ